MTPAVSVLMPVLNPHPTHFRQAVESVLGQTMPELELVIVEDPSQRSGAELLAGISDPRLRYIHNPARTSLVDQRNRTLHEARAGLVAMQDADDIAEPNRLEAQLAFAAIHPHVGVFGSQLTIIDDNDRVIGARRYPTEHREIAAAMSRYNALAQPSVMARKQVLLDAGGYQYRTYPVNEDYELWNRLAARGIELANHPEALVRYRVHAGATKSAMLRRMLRATIDVKQQFWRGRMDARARMRLYAEYALLGLPPSWVLKLFMLTQYRERR